MSGVQNKQSTGGGKRKENTCGGFSIVAIRKPEGADSPARSGLKSGGWEGRAVIETLRTLKSIAGRRIDERDREKFPPTAENPYRSLTFRPVMC